MKDEGRKGGREEGRKPGKWLACRCYLIFFRFSCSEWLVIW